MSLSSVFDHLIGPAAIVSVVFVLAQLRQNANQEIRGLIAQYNARYLEVAGRIPYEILVENKSLEHLPGATKTNVKRALYDYFLLCDEQLTLVNGRTFKRSKVRGLLSRAGTRFQVRDVKVWEQAEREWVDGIVYNFKRDAFKNAFHEVCGQLDVNKPEECFTALRRNLPAEILNS